VRGATDEGPEEIPDIGISIHAPREGSDERQVERLADELDFNPRSP